jgi:hypothetical protein
MGLIVLPNMIRDLNARTIGVRFVDRVSLFLDEIWFAVALTAASEVKPR